MTAEPQVLLEHLFRHQAGRITARLARLLGPSQLDLAEESVQDAMLRALRGWPHEGVPDNPAAWLFRVAHNSAMDAVRRRRLERAKEDAVLAAILRSSRANLGDPSVEDQLRDDELRMILMCCHPQIPSAARVALSLKVAGGFSVREIAAGMMAEDDAIAQQIVRAKKRIRDEGITLELP